MMYCEGVSFRLQKCRGWGRTDLFDWLGDRGEYLGLDGGGFGYELLLRVLLCGRISQRIVDGER